VRKEKWEVPLEGNRIWGFNNLEIVHESGFFGISDPSQSLTLGTESFYQGKEGWRGRSYALIIYCVTEKRFSDARSDYGGRSLTAGRRR